MPGKRKSKRSLASETRTTPPPPSTPPPPADNETADDTEQVASTPPPPSTPAPPSTPPPPKGDDVETESEDADAVVDSDVPPDDIPGDLAGMSRSELEKRRRELNQEIYNLERSKGSRLPDIAFTNVEEVPSADELDQQADEQIDEKRLQLENVARAIAEKEAQERTAAEEDDGADESAIDPDRMRSATFPRRSKERGEERVIEAETGKLFMPSGSLRQFAGSGGRLPEQTVQVRGEAEPRVYARSRRRSQLKEAFSPSKLARGVIKSGAMMGGMAGSAEDVAGAAAIDAATSLPEGLPGGYVRSALTGGEQPAAPRFGTNILPTALKEAAEEFSSAYGMDPGVGKSGGVMTAPRAPGDMVREPVTRMDINRKIVRAEQDLTRMQGQITDLKRRAEQSQRPGPFLARIAALEDGVEQKEAVLNQLERVKRVTIPEQMQQGSDPFPRQ